MLTMLAYAYYIEHRCLFRYILVFLSFLLGLLAKPMLVTLPCVLLLLDYWPLGRLELDRRTGLQSSILEKVPLFLLSALSVFLSSSSLTYYENFMPAEKVPIMLRIENALVSYVKYLWKTFCPMNLSTYYPYPDSLPAWQFLGAGILLTGISVLVIRSLKKMPCLGTGWLWYLGTLAPVSGLIQTGLWPAMADRWAYIPTIGIFVMIAWGLPQLLAQWRYRKTVIPMLAVAILSALMIIAQLQVQYWRNSITLFKHMIDVTENNAIAHNGFGFALLEQGKPEDALVHYRKAIQIEPDYSDGHCNLGYLLMKQGKIQDAVKHFRRALELRKSNKKARDNLGVALVKQGKISEAIAHFQEAIRIRPDDITAHYNLAKVLKKEGKITEAIAHLNKALSFKPDYADAHYNLGNILLEQKKTEEATAHFQKALLSKPNDSDTHYQLAVIFMRQGKTKNAITHFRKALLIKPLDANMHNDLGVMLFRDGNTDEAIIHFQKALQIKPGLANARNNLKKVLATSAKKTEEIQP